MKVLKFGGTSVGSAENIIRVKNIIHSVDQQVVVVVSAFGGITDRLIRVAHLAGEGNALYNKELHEIVNAHYRVIEGLFEVATQENIRQLIEPELDELRSICKGVFLIKELSRKSLESISGIGERLSSKVIAACIEGAQWFDSRHYIKTSYGFDRNLVDFELTNSLLRNLQPQLSRVSLFPGYISSNRKNENTVLGRGGSDYTAAILAAAFDAQKLEIWSDVNGFMTADPKVISRAYCIEHLSYIEAMELSHFGAKVLYPPTILPVYQSNIPVAIKNTFDPAAPGTLIDREKFLPGHQQIKGISSIKEVSLLTLQGIGMVGVTGISMRLFASLAARDINVVLISQASSENSISLVVESRQTARAIKAVEREFKREMADKRINNIIVDNGMAVVAIVGENMKRTTGVAGLLFNSVGKNGVNVYAIAQGGSELNISFVIKERDIKKALNVIHESFFLSDYSRINLFLAGKGTVGSKLLQMMGQQRDRLMRDNNLKIRLVGLASSKAMIFDSEGMDPLGAADNLAAKGTPGPVTQFRDQIIAMNLANSVFVDCSASEEVAGIYHALLQANVSVVTANKIAGSSTYATYRQLKNTAREKGVKFFFETNVGAGLPIIAPINNLVKSGDKIVRLEAVLSGTLNYIVNNLSREKPLSEVIVEAREKGFSEPDPRVDLSGIDVVRKLLILARESGYVVEQEEVEVEPFVPQSYLELPSFDIFMEKVKALDGAFEERRQQVVSQGRRLRYAATLIQGRLKVGLIEVEKSHPFYDLEGSNNIVLIWSENYDRHPMQIKGYGAGAEVTAAGVFADIIKVANV